MGVEVSVIDIDWTCARLRRAQATVLVPMSQARIVDIIARWAAEWINPDSSFRRLAAELTDAFPFEMARFSLDGLLPSLSEDALWELIDRECVRDAAGPPLIGHVVAGNTPLLAWVSLLRGLLLRSASFVKLPSGPAADWGRLFARSLVGIAPQLADVVHLAQWPGGTVDRDTALCRNVDAVVAYGSDTTLNALRVLCPPSVSFLGYGHRVSCGLLLQGACWESASLGFARDVLLYDQGGCLSPQTIFVEGDLAAAHAFAAELACALAVVADQYLQAPRTSQAALRVREARDLARMEPGTRLWEGEALRWTVVARPEAAFALSPTHGVVSVQPLADVSALRNAVRPVRDFLQGCAVAVPDGQDGQLWFRELERLGVSRLCPPGDLQRPPFAWREDNRDVLRSLLLTGRVEDDQSCDRRQAVTGE